jgi:hypothetical protein
VLYNALPFADIARSIGRLAKLHSRDALVTGFAVPAWNGERSTNLHGTCDNRASHEEAVPFDREGAVSAKGAGHANPS